MTRLPQLNSENLYQTLPDCFFSRQEPSPLTNPELVISSKSCADLLEIDADTLSEDDSLRCLAGSWVPEQWHPVAMKYFGHQFGYLNPDLGDGRGLLMAQTRNSRGELWDLHLKGSGTTPYSRGGDGRAVLRSCIREFLASEALTALGIPSTRALAIIRSDTPVYREQPENGASLLRVARSHIRFGHFEFAYHSKDKSLTETLARYVLAQHFPCLSPNPEGYADMFRLVCEATARMIVLWQSQGFAHGVMNTDNMSIIGDTFDFGPYGFMDRFRSNYICNHSDNQGRYAFDRQPAIAHWNLSVLAQALTPVLDNDALTAGLQAYSNTFNTGFMQKMRDKLGLPEPAETDSSFVFETLQMLQSCRLDYSDFFRRLSYPDLAQGLAELRDHAIDISHFDLWSDQYLARTAKQEQSTEQRSKAMQAVNPQRILRNHLAQEAIEAAKKGDYSVVKRLHAGLAEPYQIIKEYDDLSALPPEGSEELEISCSS